MEKLSKAQLTQILDVVPGTIRGLVEERDFWKKEAQARIRHDEVEKVAQAMIDKGISDSPKHMIMEQLEKAASEGKLSEIKAAVDMVGPDMGEKIASLSSGHTAHGGNAFDRFVLGGVG